VTATEEPGPHDGYATDVAELCADLLRIDTTNPGDGSGPGERQAAEYVAEPWRRPVSEPP